MTLPISRLINVSVNLSPIAAQMQNLSTLLIMGSSLIIDVVERLRSYTSVSEVATDFGTSAPEYLAAALWFEQSPQPTTLSIGRWAETASAGKLLGGLLSSTQQTIATWAAINNGAFDISIDGSDYEITALDFSAQTNMNGIAAVIQAKLHAADAGTTCVWNSTYSRFEITSPTTGVLSIISFLTAPALGTDVSGMMMGLSTSSGAYVADGIAAETALEVTAEMDNRFGQSWYALTFTDLDNDDHLAVSGYIEAANNKHLYGVTTQESGVLSALSTTDVAYLLEALARKRTVVQYSSQNAYAVCSLLGRILTVNYNGNNTTITLMYKQEPGIVAEDITSSQITALEAKKANVFVAYNNDTAIIEKGTVCSGDFLDVITGTDWLALQIQNNVFNLLYTSLTKIPQTDAGTQLITTTIESVCSQGVTNGLLAPGVWTSGGFGELKQNDLLSKGFYVYAPPVGTQFPADREARKSVPIQVAAKLAGAIHTVDVIINVNR